MDENQEASQEDPDSPFRGPDSKKLDQLSRQGSLSVFRDVDMEDLVADAEQQLASEPKYTSKTLDVPAVIVTSEISPWSKSGGLALVTASLALELAGRGRRTMAISPMYDNFANCNYIASKKIWLFHDEHEVKYYHLWQPLEAEGNKGVDYVFVDHPCYHRPGGLYYNAQEGVEYADNLFRFALFTLAALEAPCCVAPGGAAYGERVMFIANDWQSALLPACATVGCRNCWHLPFQQCLSDASDATVTQADIGGKELSTKTPTLNMQIVASDAMVLEMLHPELVPHCLGWSRTGPANLERRYPDDHENGFDGQALDYICQGLLLRHGLRPTPRLRRRAAASARRRAVLLRRLLGDSIHGCALRRQLEETFHLILPPEPGDPLDMISLMAPTAFHRCAALGGAEVLQTLSTALAWRPWLVLRGCDAPEQDDDFLDSMPAEPLLRCQQRCLQDGYGGFVVRGSQAYFRRRPASGLLHSCIAKPGDVLHIAPGPTCGLPRQSLAALLLGQTDGHRAAMDLALESGDEQAIVELGKLGCKSMMDRTADAAILDRILYGGMPQWLARAVGNLAYAGKLADDCGTALQDAQQIRGRVLEDVEQVQQATGTSTAVAEALLRHFGHSPEAAISQFQVDAKAAKTAAGIREGPTSSELVCGICFAGLEPGGDSLRRLLPCEGSHAFCDACLRQYLEGLLASGNVRGMVCPEPECRLPLGEACIEGILGSAARQKFVRLAALQAVDAAAHICWCPQPGCEKAVARTGGLTVRCACGYTFCSSCKLPGGHEPCTCEQIAEWKAVHGDFVGAQEQRQRQQDRAESWVRRNAQHCPGCRAIVQRNGGCNHMVCRCGTHFCYVCGRPWDEHTSQEGGIDYYVCRMPKADRNSHALDNTMVQQFEDPVAEFQMLERSEAWARRWAEDAYQLCQAVQYSEAAAFATPREDTKPTEQMLS
ncbi:ARI5, partial [Symbiodinium microadriaticum]